MNRFRFAAFALFVSTLSTASAATIELEVNGLVCAFCAQGIEKSLRQFPATDDVFVSLEHRLVAVSLKDGLTIEDAPLKKAITDAGYTPVGVTRSDQSLELIRARVHNQAGHDD